MVADSELKVVSSFFYDTLGRGRAAVPQLAAVKDEQVFQWLDHLQGLSGDQLIREVASVREKLCKAAAYGQEALRSQLEDALVNQAKNLGYQKPEIHWSGRSLLFRADAFNRILSAFHHLIRNSLDQGFTKAADSISPIIRLEAQLLPQGRLRLVYQDNGNGLNLKQLHHKVSQTHPLQPRINDNDIAEFIFTQGVSVKDNVSETSGRGIGMDAVRNTCQQLGGTIHVRYTAPVTADGYRAFVFEIDLAAQDLLSWPLPSANMQVA